MSVVPIVPRGSAPPLAPYSPGAKAGNAIYTSGALPIGPNGETIGAGDAKEQTRHVMETVKGVIEAGGGTLSDVAFVHIFIKDAAYYKDFNQIYAEYFPERPPARYCIVAELVKPEFLVEVAAIAYLDSP